MSLRSKMRNRLVCLFDGGAHADPARLAGSRRRLYLRQLCSSRTARVRAAPAARPRLHLDARLLGLRRRRLLLGSRRLGARRRESAFCGPPATGDLRAASMDGTPATGARTSASTVA